MRLAISNIAWDVAEDDAIAGLLGCYAIDAIDVAPSKYFPDPTQASDLQIAGVRQYWADQGIEITGMQSLLFGTTGLNVFGSPAVQAEMLSHLSAICRIGAGLGATRLVFGSPKNRDRSGLDDQQAQDIATRFFRQMGDIAQAHGVLICLEPNPARYGANFMITSEQTAAVVRDVAHPAIRMQLDTGALTVNGEDVEQVLANSAALIGHVHASEPDLLPLGDGSTPHRAMASAIGRHLPQHIVAIEMLTTHTEPHVTSIERALAVAVDHYREPSAGVNA